MTPLGLALGLGLPYRGAPGSFVAALPGAYAGLGGVSAFTRADATTCATYIDANGVVQTVAAAVLRDSHYIAGIRTILLESSQTNICTSSESISNPPWVSASGPTRTPAYHTASGISLDLVGDASAVGACANLINNVGYTGDGQKLITFHIRQGTSAGTWFRQRDITAAANRLSCVVTWAAGVPTVTMTTGTLFEAPVAIAAGVWRFTVLTTAAIAANTNELDGFWASDTAANVVPVGDIGFGGVMVRNNATVATSYIKTVTPSAVTRAVDALTLAGTSAFAAPTTLYQHYFDLATQAWVGAASAYTPGNTIVPVVDRAYMMLAVCLGTLTAAQCRTLIGGTFP